MISPMTSQLRITTANLNNILALYARDTPLKNLILGDTCHPVSGYINEQTIKKVESVSSLLEFDYDFPCLVEFSATIGRTQVKLVGDVDGKARYIVTGPSQEIRTIRNALIEKTAINKSLYDHKVKW